ncbi:glutathione S-transferase family protein [Martelella limonii]|uniref:glutathione S-transferase family protein n=1 Tax=Martelella limonii TaxID=1647649 RepID=UPI001580C26C|nr:glutathione S-transferase family protein [Martelella limonii]
MLKVWGRKNSLNVQIVMWTIAELGLDYERYDIGHRFGGNDTPEYLAMNPNGLVPVITDGGDPIFESAAICRYLAARYGDDAFWSEDPARRAQIDKWAEWAKATLYPVIGMQIFWPLVRMTEEERDMEAVGRGVVTYDRLLGIAESQLEGHAYLAGDVLTLSDIAFGHQLFRYYTLPIDRPARPRVEAYYERLSRRPAYAEHVMVSYDSLRP